MPKKSQRKRKAKQEDFKKAKLKVGKKKPQSSNYTDLSFKSRAILLPTQSISEDKSKAITNSRKLTVKDLLIQFRHHNSGTRKDAIQGLKDLFKKHASALSSSLGTVLNASICLIIDEDKDVRKSLFSFFSEFLPGLKKVDLIPFFPLLTIYTCSAMTHIHDDIRVDALHFMNTLLLIAPEVIVNGFWDKILPNYINLLTSNPSIGMSPNQPFSVEPLFPNTRSEILSHEAKINVLQSLRTLLEAGLVQNNNSRWYFLHFLSNEESKRSFDHYKETQETIVDWEKTYGKVNFSPPHPLRTSLISNCSDLWTSSRNQINLFQSNNSALKAERIHIGSSSFSTNTAENFLNKDDISSIKTRLHSSMDHLNYLHPVLLSMWLDAAPSVFGSASASIYQTSSLRILHFIIKILDIIWKAVVIESGPKIFIDTYGEQLLKHLAIYFPFGWETFQNYDAKVESTLLEMNILFCELIALYSLAINGHDEFNHSNSHTPHLPNNKTPRSIETKLIPFHRVLVDRIGEYVLHILGWKQPGDNMGRGLPKFNPEIFATLFPTIWCMLNLVNQEQQSIVFQAVIEYSNKCHNQSIARRTCIEFIAESFLLQSHPFSTGSFHIDSKLSSSVRRWLLSLPKVLWELKSNNLETTEKILQFMCDIVKRGTKGGFDKEAFNELQMAFVPFLFVNVPNKGSIFGPFPMLPYHIQRKTLEFLFYCPSLNEKIQCALNEVLQHEKVSSQLKNYADILFNGKQRLISKSY
ncbi:hypothetical protein G9A89_018589 [Geosiphon pyriformis]|nr:hypothetical protein G9A89_018589 [Geosiphon pyriformis]